MGRVGDGGLVVRVAVVVVSVVGHRGGVAGRGRGSVSHGASHVSRAKGVGSRLTGCLPFLWWLLMRRVRYQALSQRPLGFVPSPLLYTAAIPACARAFPPRLAGARAGKIVVSSTHTPY